jgi:hypothetical protein
MHNFTIPFSVDLPNFRPFCSLVPELQFRDLAELEKGAVPGPFVYVLVEPRGGILYFGKSDSVTGSNGKRALSYAKWGSDYLADVAKGGWPDPIHDLVSGDLSLTGWVPIIRFATRHQATIKVASVTHTGLSGKAWEARLQAMSGVLTGLESLVGGSGWEANVGTLRGDGYDWACERIEELREDGTIAA